MQRLCFVLAYGGVAAVANLRQALPGPAPCTRLSCPRACRHRRHGHRVLVLAQSCTCPACCSMPSTARTPTALMQRDWPYAAGCRGGGEYGIDWRDAGSVHNKQNVFDDFAACAEHLVSSGHTSPGRLTIQGASNGGAPGRRCGSTLNPKPQSHPYVQPTSAACPRHELHPRQALGAPHLSGCLQLRRALLAGTPG